MNNLVAPGLPCDAKLAGVSDMDFDLIAFSELGRFDHSGRKADGETVSPNAQKARSGSFGLAGEMVDEGPDCSGQDGAGSKDQVNCHVLGTPVGQQMC